MLGYLLRKFSSFFLAEKFIENTCIKENFSPKIFTEKTCTPLDRNDRELGQEEKFKSGYHKELEKYT